MNNQVKYLALTIGPIHKTMQSVKSTKGIWSASYMFSNLMKRIIQNLIEVEPGSQRSFLMPYIEYAPGQCKINWHESSLKGVGLIPDRFIMEAEEGDFDKLQNVIRNVLENFADKAATSLRNHFTSLSERKVSERKNFYATVDQAELKKMIADYMVNYFQAYFIEINNPPGNPVLEIQKYLDNLELQQKIVPKEEYPFLHDLFENCYYNFMIMQEFGQDKDSKFPSTIEIAARQFEFEQLNDSFNEKVKEILKSDDNKSQEKFIKALKDKKSFPLTDFRQHHKYLAVIQADGDNLGFFIRSIYEVYTNPAKAKEVFQKFSYNLMTFSRCAVTLIKEFGGTNIYAGGDDLLYFAPVMIRKKFKDFSFASVLSQNKNLDILNEIYDLIKTNEPENKSVFWLIDIIDHIFNLLITKNQLFTEVVDHCTAKGKIPSMSYGISVSYYKYPLNEALEHGIRLLFEVAKQTSKNAVSFNVLKHSGQFFGTTFLKSSKSYKVFSDLLASPLEDNNYLSSVMYKLDDQELVLDEITHAMPEKINLDDPSDRLSQFFRNNFNEMIHQEGNKKEFITKTRNLVQAVFNEPPIKGSHSHYSLQYKMEKIYATLRFIHFLKSRDKDE